MSKVQKEEGIVRLTATFLDMILSSDEMSANGNAAMILETLLFLGLPEKHVLEAHRLILQNLNGFRLIDHLMPKGT